MRRTEVVKHATVAVCCWLAAANALSQGLLVDQASGTVNELIQNSITLPGNATAQSFTPSLSAVGFIQLQAYISAASSGETVMINLRQDAYNGPIVSSTDPVFLINKITQINTFYFSGNVPITPNQIYYFEPVVLSAGNWNIGYKSPSGYDRGQLFSNGLPDNQADLWFIEGIVVPEPGTVWMLLFGGSMFLWHRRVAKKSWRRHCSRRRTPIWSARRTGRL